MVWLLWAWLFSCSWTLLNQPGCYVDQQAITSHGSDGPHALFNYPPFEGHVGSLQLLDITENAAMNVHVQVFVWICFHFSGGKCLWIPVLEHRQSPVLGFLGIAKWFPRVAVPFTFPPTMDNPVFSLPHQHLMWSLCVTLNMCAVVLHCGFNLCLPSGYWYAHLFESFSRASLLSVCPCQWNVCSYLLSIF